MKHYFLGSNTPYGFMGYYNNVNDGGRHLYILKGGSGVGKHTFMSQIARSMEEEGYHIDYCHCSNDPDSLDGIIIKELEVAIIDGTSPHAVDPRLPGCFDEIIDLGKYIQRDKVIPHRDKIRQLSEKKKAQYSRAYTFLSCAKTLYDDNTGLILSCLHQNKWEEIAGSLSKSLISKAKTKSGKVSHCFASAYTSKGYIDYLPTLTKDIPTVAISNYRCLNGIIMEELAKEAQKKGMKFSICHSPINPSSIDHLIFDSFAIISKDEYNKVGDPDEIISLTDCIDKDKITDVYDEISRNNEQIDGFLSRATDTMSSCSKLHSQLEEIYIPSMNFDGVDKERLLITEEIRKFKK